VRFTRRHEARLIKIEVSRATSIFFKELWRISKKAYIGFIMLILIAFLGILSPLISPADPTQMMVGSIYEKPSLAHPFGTDSFGRDILSRCLYGIRLSLGISLFVTTCAMILGVFLGTFSAYIGGRVDEILAGGADILFALPTVLLALVAATIIGPGLRTVIISLIIVYTPQYFRLTRGSVLGILHNEYIEAARALGASDWRIIRHHILPNCLAPILVQTALAMSFVILDEAALSFLGLGTQPPTPSLGLMLRQGLDYLYRSSYLTIFPGLMIFICVLTFNLLGDGLREVLDPYLRR